MQQSGPWIAFSLFESSGQCLANVDTVAIPFVLDERLVLAAGIRSVAVDPAWRGRGLFRDLLNEALAWGDAQGAIPTFLYTGDPAIYEGFGFRGVPQHAFVGPAPAAVRGPMPARRLDLATASDRAIAHKLLSDRAPISSQCALEIDAAQFFANVAKDPDLEAAHITRPEALILFESDGDDLTLVDIVAPAIPRLETILGALGLKPRRVKTLFPPDRLGWVGAPVVEDTGLMIRGATPPALTRPFMFPPTAEF